MLRASMPSLWRLVWGERGAASADIEAKDAALAAKLESQIRIVADLDRRLARSTP
jgi:hypothetical protein